MEIVTNRNFSCRDLFLKKFLSELRVISKNQFVHVLTQKNEYVYHVIISYTQDNTKYSFFSLLKF